MARRVKRATRADTDALPHALPEEPATSYRYHHQLRHGTNSLYTHNSSSSSLLADDEDEGSSAGSPDEADGELCQSHCLPNNSQSGDLGTPHVIGHPRHAKRCNSQSSDGENRL
jgi:hypothetical protein